MKKISAEQILGEIRGMHTNSSLFISLDVADRRLQPILMAEPSQTQDPISLFFIQTRNRKDI
jgi:hypothetical protein